MGYGYNLRIGLLVPSSNTTMEPEFYEMIPDGFSVHPARMMLEEVTTERLVEMAEDALRGAALLATADVDVVIYGCTSGSIIGGVQWEESLVRRIQSQCGIPSYSTGKAVVDALKTLGGRRIGVVTPYTDDLNELEVKFLEENGLKVVAIEGLGLVDNLEIGRVEPRTVLDLVQAVKNKADTIFISCTNLPATRLIDKLEMETCKPVVTSNQASFWAALRGTKFSVSGFGVLLNK